MRNLLQYPITTDETCSVLQDAQQAYYKKYKNNMGNIHGLSLLYAEKFIRENKVAFDEFTKKLPEAK